MPPLPLPDVGDSLADLEALVGNSSWSGSPEHLEACADAVAAFFEPLGDVEVVPVEPSRDVDPTGRLVEQARLMASGR